MSSVSRFIVIPVFCFLLHTQSYGLNPPTGSLIDAPTIIDVSIPPPPVLTTDKAEATGVYDLALLRPEIERRDYRIYIPPTYDHNSGNTMAVIFVFHGLGATAEIMFDKFSEDLDPSVPLDYIVVFPEGKAISHPIWTLTSPQSWNAFHCCGGSFATHNDDTQFVRLLLEELISVLHVDEQRVFATGFSNGAMFTHRIGIELSDLFTAIAPVAGSVGGCDGSGDPNSILPPTSLRNPWGPGICYGPQSSLTPIPVYMIRGTADTIVKFSDGLPGDWSDFFLTYWRWDSSAGFDFDLWTSANFNNCGAGPNIISIIPGVGQSKEDPCGATPVKILELDGVGHKWPTLNNTASYNGTQSILDFFDRF